MSAIDQAWADLQAFLSSVTDWQASVRDANGWTIVDHTTHIAVWEDSVTVLFRGGKRHEALGIDQGLYNEASYDQINAIIRDRYQNLSLPDALAKLTNAHAGLMARVRPLTEGQLRATVSVSFPQAPRGDDRSMAAFIFDNTADHFQEHLRWMKDLALPRPKAGS
jgi:hypothetical protein